MRKLILFGFFGLALTGLFLMDGCKKGKGDPFLSLRSRKTRVAGTWKVVAMQSEVNTTTTDPNGDVITQKQTIEFDGVQATTTSTSTTGGSTETSTSTQDFTQDYTFDKDGTWKGTKVQTSSGSDSVNIYNSNTGLFDPYLVAVFFTTTTSSTGTWDFLSGTGKDFKNKENMVIKTTSYSEQVIKLEVFSPIGNSPSRSNVTSTTTTDRETNSMNEIWTISTLKHKQMVVAASLNSSYVEKVDGIQDSDLTVEEGEISMTLEP